MSKAKQKLRGFSGYMGADPELFLNLGGRIIGSEKVIPKTGIAAGGGEGKIVRDGVQVELQPVAFTCRQSGRSYFHGLLANLHNHLQYNLPKFKVKPTLDFSRTIELTEEEFDSLSEESKQLGCMPSLNIYEKRPLEVSNPRIRSAGGHIHLSLHGNQKGLITPPDQFVKLLDVVVGNTCVLFDQDPGVKVRRETYGRAGEYRLPQHGLEYRVLSNFWLSCYPAMSMVFGLARLAEMIAWTQEFGKLPVPENPYRKDATGYYAKHYSAADLKRMIDQWDAQNLHNSFPAADELLAEVDLKRVIYAINENDPDEARVTFEILKSFVAERVDRYDPGVSHGPSLNAANIEDFDFLTKVGFGRFYGQDYLANWNASNSISGFEHWLSTTVHNARIADQRAAKKEAA